MSRSFSRAMVEAKHFAASARTAEHCEGSGSDLTTRPAQGEACIREREQYPVVVDQLHFSSRVAVAVAVCAKARLAPFAQVFRCALMTTVSQPSPHPEPSTPVSTTASVSLHPHSALIPGTPPCLAEAAPHSTSPASATAPAPATSPTSSNGTSHNAIIPPNAVDIVVASTLRPCPVVPACRCCLRLPLLRARTPPASPLAPSPSARAPAGSAGLPPPPSAHRVRRQPSLTLSKVRSPRPLRHSGPALRLVSPVSISFPARTRLALTVQQVRFRRVREPP